ncbi:hypothetical protein FGB62_65g015 [Gracilaria domingensis]|nr:hypothetical protein FGB62_65g015 [Gracilaria domingensis]
MAPFSHILNLALHTSVDGANLINQLLEQRRLAVALRSNGQVQAHLQRGQPHVLRLVAQLLADGARRLDGVVVIDLLAHAVLRVALDGGDLHVPLLEQVDVEKQRRVGSQRQRNGVGRATVDVKLVLLADFQPRPGNEHVVVNVRDGGLDHQHAAVLEHALEQVVRGRAIAAAVLAKGGANGLGLRAGDTHLEGILGLGHGAEREQAAVVTTGAERQHAHLLVVGVALGREAGRVIGRLRGVLTERRRRRRRRAGRGSAPPRRAQRTRRRRGLQGAGRAQRQRRAEGGRAEKRGAHGAGGGGGGEAGRAADRLHVGGRCAPGGA